MNSAVLNEPPRRKSKVVAKRLQRGATLVVAPEDSQNLPARTTRILETHRRRKSRSGQVPFRSPPRRDCR
jgi:hypothetical protein